MNEFEKWLLDNFGLRSASDLTVENMDEIQSRALMTPGSFNDEDRSVELIIATEAAVRMPDFSRMEMVDEVLVMAGMTVRGDRDKIKYFTEHERDVRSQIGSIINLRLDNDKLLGKAIYSSVEQDLYVKTREGHCDEISAGYKVLNAQYLEVGSAAIIINGVRFQATERTLKIAWEWEIFEGTLTALGADIDAGVRSEAMQFETRSFFGEPKFITKLQQRKGGSEMNPELRKQLILDGMPSNATEDEARTYCDEAILRGFAYQVPGTPPTPAAPVVPGADPIPMDLAEVRRITEASEARSTESLRQAQEILDGVQAREVDAQIRAVFEPYMNHTSTDDTIVMTEVRQTCVDAKNLDAAGRRLLEILPSLDQPAGRSHITRNGPDGDDNFRTNAALSLRARAGIVLEGDDLERSQNGHEFCLFDLARVCIERSGQNVHGMDRMGLVGRALAGSDDFQNILLDAINKSLSSGYRDAPQIWKMFTARKVMGDFRPHYVIKMGQSGHLPEVLEGEAFPNFAPGDNKETITLKTHGKIICLTRQSIINDDLDAFHRLPSDHARAWARTIDRLMIYVLLRNADLEDGIALFHADHNNLQSGLGAPSTVSIMRATLKKMSTLLTQQLDLDGESPLSLPPVLVITGTTHQWTLKEALKEVDRTTENTDVALREMQLAIGIDPYIDLSNAKAGITGTPDSTYMFANPQDNPVVEAGFLDGNDAPRLEQEKGFDIDGVKLKVAGDVAAAATDFRGAVKSIV